MKPSVSVAIVCTLVVTMVGYWLRTCSRSLSAFFLASRGLGLHLRLRFLVIFPLFFLIYNSCLHFPSPLAPKNMIPRVGFSLSVPLRSVRFFCSSRTWCLPTGACLSSRFPRCCCSLLLSVVVETNNSVRWLCYYRYANAIQAIKLHEFRPVYVLRCLSWPLTLASASQAHV